MGQKAHIILSVLLLAQWCVCWRLALRLVAAKAIGGASVDARGVSVIIPARNEEENLPGLLESLESQRSQPLEIIVVDDDSEDATARIAEAHGATVVHPGPPPSGWRGKSWACHSGANLAYGKYLLFLDADTQLVTDQGLSRLLDCYPGGAWSLVPWHRTGSGAEAFSAFFNLLMAVGTIPDGLAGPCLMISRADYTNCGGHEAVRDKILENFHLKEVLNQRGVQTGSANGRGIADFRMYPGGFGELIPGWTKGFASGAASTPKGTLLLVIIWMSALWAAAMMMPFSPILAGIYLLYVAQVGWMLRQAGNFPWWTALFYPVPLIFHLAVFIRSFGSAAGNATWKGRSVTADDD